MSNQVTLGGAGQNERLHIKNPISTETIMLNAVSDSVTLPHNAGQLIISLNGQDSEVIVDGQGQVHNSYGRYFRNMKMNFLKTLIIVTTIGLLLASAPSRAQSLIQQWKQGLSNTKLTSYSGSVISSNSTLMVINLCGNGRYSYYQEGSWSVPGTAGGASNNRATGSWDIQQIGDQVVLAYVADNGTQGSFPIYLQMNGYVNIGGTAYAVQQGGAEC